LDEVVRLGRTVGAAIFAIGLGTKVDRPVLERLAAESGGEAYFSTDASLLAEQYHRVIETLRRRYVLSYTSKNAEHDGEWRTVTLKAKGGDLIIKSSGGYFAPEQ